MLFVDKFDNCSICVVGFQYSKGKKNQFILMRFKVIVEEFNRLGNHVHSLASPHESENKGIKY